MKTQQATSKLRAFYKGAPARLGAVLAVGVATIVMGSTVMAWGPERQTFVASSPADYVTFNSMTDNTKVGDERNFVRIREAGVGNYRDDMKLVPGKEYEVSIFYHNNAKDSLNASGAGVAQNTSLKVKSPSVVRPGERGAISGTISASNARPGSVWDEAFVTSDTDIALRYVPGSATVTSNGKVNGQKLPDSFLTTGALLGYDSLNGKLPGCTQYSGFVTYKFRADAPNFTIKKQVRKAGETTWQDKIVAKVGEKVEFLISYRNTGTVQQDNVVVKDALPVGVSYVAGSSMLANSKHPNGKKANDGVATNGLNIGSYAPQGNAAVRLTATIDKVDKCGGVDLVNYGTIITQNGNKQTTAIVRVEEPCKPNECKPGIPHGDARCSEPCKPKAGEVVDANGNCVPAATSLPKTGPAEMILSFIGLIALVGAIAYWYKSRQDVKKLLAGGNANVAADADAAETLVKEREDTTSEKK